MLQFFGIANGLSKEKSNSAFFEYRGNLILLDCSIDTCRELLDFDLSKYKNIYVLVTHTHSDHVGGIGMLAAYLGWWLNRTLCIVMPTEKMVDSFRRYLIEIEGANPAHFKIGVKSDFYNLPDIESIKTSHTHLLEGKCFGWVIKIENKYIVYTGDTNTLSPFTPYISEALLQHFDVYLYTEISTMDSGAHLYIDKVYKTLVGLSNKGVKIFLMHIDNVGEIKRKIKGSKISIAPLYDPKRYNKLNKKTVIIINGKGGCGKDTLIRGVADRYRVKNVSSIDHIKDIATQIGWSGTKDEKSRTFLAELKQLCIKFNDMPLHDMISEYENFMNGNDEILFIHIREGEEIDKIKRYIKGAKTVLVKREETDNGVYTNAADNDVEKYEYDYIFDNNGDIKERQEEFNKLIKSLR